MRVIIAGSRGITELSILKDAIFCSDFSIREVVSGCARGVDSLGEQWADLNGIPVRQFPANWGRFGRAAGMYRNSDMADYADAAIILWDGESRGTLDMISKIRAVGKPREIWMGFDYIGA